MDMIVLFPHDGALVYAKAVLFVDDGDSKSAKLHVVFDEGMGTYEDVYRAIGYAPGDLSLLLCLCRAREQADRRVERGEELAQAFVMLSGKYLGGCHHAGLVAIVHSKEHGEEGNNRLATADISLDEAVHLLSALEVGVYFPDDSLLCVCEIEG